MLSKIDENILLLSPKFLKEKDYWIKKLSGDIGVTDIQVNSKKDDTFQKDLKKVEIVFPRDLVGRIIKLSKNSNISIFIILLAGLKSLIYRYTNKEDIIVISPVNKQEITEETINNYLCIRDQIKGEMSFKELVLAIRQSVLQAYKNQDYPFDQLIEYCFGTPPGEHSKLISNIVCSLRNIHHQRDISEIKRTLYFSFFRDENGLKGDISFDPTRYEKNHIEHISMHFTRILEISTADVNLKISDISYLSKEEKKQLLIDFNNHKGDFSRDKTIYHFIEKYEEKTPDRTAITFKGNHLTYRKLNEGANQLARFLRKQGTQINDVAGIMLDRSDRMAVSILATWKAGGAYIPIDPEYPISRVTGILKDSGARMLLTGSEYIDSDLEGAYEGKPVKLDTQRDEIQKESPFNLDLEIDMSRVAYIIYTSGSTGEPKGAMVEHIGMMNHIEAKINDLQISNQSIIAQNASHTFDISIWQFFSAFAAGGKTAIYTKLLVLDPHRFIGQLIIDQVTILELVPSYLSVMLECLDVNPRKLEQLDYLLVTGETLKPRLVERWFRKYPMIKIVNAYGPTEASDDITHFIMKKTPGMEQIPIGKPLQNLNIYILDDNMKLCPIGVKGEICVSGIGVGRGYVNDSERTNDLFREDPFVEEKGIRLYKTGDLGRLLSDGTIEFFGRKDYQVKIRGFRIELGEIETQLTTHAEIKEVVVVDKKDKQENRYICAYLTTNRTVDISSIREYLMERLPDYMIPLHFVKLDRMPLTPNGKIDRSALPEPEAGSMGNEYTAPGNRIEEKLVEVWAEVVGAEKDIIGINANFFEIGGHSLKATILGAKIHREFNVKIPLEEIFKFPTIKQQAEYIIGAQKDIYRKKDDHLVLIKKGDSKADNLFLVHDSTGEVEAYMEFCHYLNQDFNYWGIRAEKMTNYTPANLTIPGLAARYIDKIKNIQSSGPYYIAGWSSGGPIAYEMVRQLEQMQESMGFLGLIDSLPPQPPQDKREEIKEFTLESELNWVLEYFPDSPLKEKLTGISRFNQLWPLIVDYLKTNESEASRIKQLIPIDVARVIPHFEQLEIGDLIDYLNMGRSFDRAFANYCPPNKIMTPVHFFCAKQTNKINHNYWNIWKSHCSNLIFYEISGDHFSIMKEPDAIRFAGVFAGVMGSAKN